MTLALVTAPSPIQAYPSGLIVIRCEDYLGPARGSLTTVIDNDSVAGTVVEDTQTIAVATGAGPVNQTTRFGLASDTLRVPWTDITALYDNTNAQGVYAFLGMRVVGEAPSSAQHLSSFYTHTSSGGSVAAGYGHDTTHITSTDVWKSVWGDQYRITAPLPIFDSSFTGTNLTVRAWGITGGTIELYLDVLYLQPFGGGTTAGWDTLFTSQFPPLEFGPNGTLDRDFDLDATDNVIGKFSVVFFDQGYKSSAQWESSTATDYQEANDEVTILDATNGTWGGFGTPPLVDPPSWMNFETCPFYLPAQTIIADDFPNVYTVPAPPPTINPVISTPSMFTKTFTKGDSGTAGDTGLSEQGGYVQARGTGGTGALMTFGNGNLITGDANNIQNHHPLLTDLEECIQTIAFESDTLYDLRILVGKQTPNPEITFDGAVVRLDGAGNLDLTLENWGNAVLGPTPDQIAFAGPFSVTTSYAANDRYWIKVEKRAYFWRAKCWLDGTTEPDWQIEGWDYLESSDSGNANDDWVGYPYDTNWTGNVNHDIVKVDPRDEFGPPSVFVNWETGSAAVMIVRYYDYLLEVDPAGTSPRDMFVQETNYDDTSPSNSLRIPFSAQRSWRMVEASRRVRHFNTDTNGYNFRVWKDTGAPEMQSSAVPFTFEKVMVQGGIIPLYRPRVFSVKTP